MRVSTSLILTTYNWENALTAVLRSIAVQHRLPDEVIVADDGSGEDTRLLIQNLAQDFPVPLHHVWQEDEGFRAAQARNRAIASSRCEYILMIDGDMVLHPDFVADHQLLAQAGCYLQGKRFQATPDETRRLLNGGSIRIGPLQNFNFHERFCFHRRHAWHAPWLAHFKARLGHPGAVMSCNMSFWRKDLIRINGFDERMQGYGSEDLELAVRLDHLDLRRRSLRYAALAVHLYHASRAVGDRNDPGLPNNGLLEITRRSGCTWTEYGLNRYLHDFRNPPQDLYQDPLQTVR